MSGRRLAADLCPAGDVPLVVFDASTGMVLLNPSVLQALQSTPGYVVSGAVQATLAAAQRLLQLAGQVSSGRLQLRLLAGSLRLLTKSWPCVSKLLRQQVPSGYTADTEHPRILLCKLLQEQAALALN
jgi:hypothetical protein